MNKIHYALYLNPPRPTFMQEMTNDERKIMQQHIVYWTDYMNKGMVLVFGLLGLPHFYCQTNLQLTEAYC